MPPSGEALITPATGGKLTVDRVTVEFPAGAVDRDMTLRIAVKDLPTSPKYARFKYAFDLEGRAGAGLQGSPVSRFRRQPKVLVDTRGLGLTEEEQRRNLVWHYDEAERRWKPLTLLSRPAPGVVALETSHFSGFAMGPTSDPIPPAPPGLEGYQTDLLTGSARTIYAIEVPPGMGGLTPKLEIPYSSVAVDEMNRSYAQNGNPDNQNFSQQASVVGLGFDFEPGCIVAPTADGPRYLRVGGRSSRIIQNQADGSWRTEDEWFWKVLLVTPSMQQRNGGTYENGDGAQYWLAWDKDGTEYRFGFTLHSNHTIGGGYEYRYDLDRIKDTRSNYIQYVWDETTDNESGGNYDSDRDFWLTEIRYTGNTVQSISPQRCIVFNWESRTDFIERADYDQPPNYVHRKRLASIEVFGDIARTIRVSKYVFSYTYDSPWWHGFNEQQQDVQVQALPKLLLLSVTRYGADGTSALPPTSFTYYSGSDPLINGWKPKPWLKTANNGYGGKATYVYQYFTPTNFQYQWLKFRARLTSRKWEDLGVTGNPAVEYTYQYGDSYDFMETWNHAPRAEFRGHDWVLEMDSLGHYTRSWFYTFRSSGQTQNGKTDAEVHILKGRMWQQAKYDSIGNLLAYDTSDLNYTVTGTAPDGSNSYFIKLLGQDSHLGNKHKKVEYVYDDDQGSLAYGNILREYYNRDITGEAQKTVRRSFYVDTARWIVSKISWERVFGGIVDVADANLPTNWAKFTAWGYYNNGDVFHTAAQITNGLVYRLRNYYKNESGQEQSILTKYGYDPYGNRTSMTDPNACATNPEGSPTTYDYDNTYHTFLVKTTLPGGTVFEERGYDLGRGLLTSINDSNHRTSAPANDTRTLYEYDTFGRIIKTIRPGDDSANPTLRHTYLDNPGPITLPFQVLTERRKNASGGTGQYHQTRTFYDGLGREVQSYSDAISGHACANTYYDSRGLRRRGSIPHAVTGTGSFLQSDWTDWLTQAAGKPGTDRQYDALRRQTRVTNPDDSYRDTAYRDWEAATTDENRHQKKQTMDAFGRLIRVDEYTGTFQTPNLDATPYASTYYGYNVLDNLATIKDAVDGANPSTVITWNELSRKTQMVDPDMGTWKYQQDANGNVIRQEDARHKVVKIGYDAMNRPRRKTYWTAVWNGQQWMDQTDGNWVDELSTSTTIGIYDIAEIRSAINANRVGASLTNKVWEGLSGETDPDNRTFIAGRTTVRAIHFNEMRNAIRDLPNMATKQFTQFQGVPGDLDTSRLIKLSDPTDLRGWIQDHEAANGVAARVYFRYDDYTDGVFRDNAKGRRTEMWDASGHTIWIYDRRGRVIEERRYIDGKVYVTSWTYDAMDRVMSMTYPDGEVVSYAYNNQFLLDSMTGAIQGQPPQYYLVTGTGYNAAGLPTSVTYNSVTTTLGYNAQTLRLTSISATGVLSLGYTHQPNGNISQITDGQDTINLGYDDLDRILSANGAFAASYTIDQIGRISSKNEGGASRSYDYNGTAHKHAPVSITPGGGSADPQSYDDNGNLTGASGLSLKYNAENQLVKVSQGSAYVARFISDGDGQRRKRIDSFGTVVYVGPHYERNVGTGADTSDVTTKMYWAQLGPFRRLIAVRKGANLSYLHHDHLGGTKAISGTTGGPMKYYPFGSTYQEISSPPTDNLYTGQKRDMSTGLYFYGARYYNPMVGMFAQPDTIVPQPGNPQSLNRFAYCLNNPLGYTDPTGHASMPGPGTQRVEPPPVDPPVNPPVEEPMSYTGEVGPSEWEGYSNPGDAGTSASNETQSTDVLGTGGKVVDAASNGAEQSRAPEIVTQRTTTVRVTTWKVKVQGEGWTATAQGVAVSTSTTVKRLATGRMVPTIAAKAGGAISKRMPGIAGAVELAQDIPAVQSGQMTANQAAARTATAVAVSAGALFLTAFIVATLPVSAPVLLIGAAVVVGAGTGWVGDQAQQGLFDSFPDVFGRR